MLKIQTSFQIFYKIENDEGMKSNFWDKYLQLSKS